MVRNNRRKAFTIVELVIVIAVIAILAAVMIPTFTGIIKRANISADQQLAASINTQLSIYKAEGNKIETEADLLKALQSDEDFTAHLNPKSAKHGYHYWYDATKQAVELLTYDEVLDELKTHNDKHINQIMMDEFAAGGDGEVKVKAAFNPDDFAKAAPRTIVPGFYFLDQTGENENEIASFFADIASMSKSENASEIYTKAINNLKTLSESKKSENKALAADILARINATAVMTDKGTFINPPVDADGKIAENAITYIYIPAPALPAEGEQSNYYLNHTVHHANDETKKDLHEIANVTDIIEIPEGVKVAEGSFTGFGAITVLVDVKDDQITNLRDVLSAGAVAENAAVRVNGANYTIVGNKVYQGETYMQGADLTYRNPVTDFEIAADNAENNIITIVVQKEDNTTETNHYIALDKIKNVQSSIKLVLNAKNFAGTPNIDTPVYEEVVWSTDTTGVHVDEKGVVTFNGDFNADTITFKASAKAVNDVKVEKEFTVKVLRLYSAQINFAGDGTGTATLSNKVGENSASVSSNLFVGVLANAQGAITTAANFTTATNFMYAYKDTQVTLSTEQGHYTKLGINTGEITTTIVANNQTYFTLNQNKALVFQKISTLMGGYVTQYIEVTVSDGASTITGKVGFTLNDNTNSPVENTFPTYKPEFVKDEDGEDVDVTYVYKVGNTDTLPLEEIFKKKGDTDANLDNHYLFVFADAAKDNEGYFWGPIAQIPLKDSNNNDLDKIDLRDTTKFNVGSVYWLVIGEREVKTRNDKEIVVVSTNTNVTNMVRVEVVSGKNFTDTQKLTNLTKDNGEFAYATYEYYDIVLHDDFNINTNTGLNGELDGKPDIFLNDTALYGNYFIITAKEYKDDKVGGQGGSSGKSLMTDGHSLIEMRGTSSLNQVIIDGPLYNEPAYASNEKGLFCFGVLCWNTTTITDSYIYGFMSPVRVRTGTLELKNSVLESGTWANLFVYEATKITLDNSMTIQDYYGYEPTVGTSSNRLIGLGIYLHDELAGDSIEIVFKGDTKQINWFGANANFGGYASQAKTVVFMQDWSWDKGTYYVYEQFMHTYNNNEKFVNAGIAFQATSSHPTVNLNFDDWTVDGEDTNIKYGSKKATVLSVYKTMVCSPIHEGTCESCEMLSADMANVKNGPSFGADWFRGERVNSEQ